MAARRRRRSSQDDACLAQAIGLLLGIGLIGGAIVWLIAHPVVSVPLGLAVTTATGIGVRNRIRDRRQQRIRAAENARLAAIREAEEERARIELERVYAIRMTEIQSYYELNARQFEEAIAYLCERDGCTNVCVVGGAGDLGADVKATAPDGRRIVIQCKRYAPSRKIGSQDVQRFGGTCWTEHGAQVAALVTTAQGFTKAAAQYADRQRIGQYDADRLAGWASRTGPAPWM